MGYLLPTEYAQYGLTAETTDDWITTASALMEGYCRRSTLLASQYVERLRLTAGAQTVHLSYRPLVVVNGATSPLLAVRARYGRPRRGEIADNFREQVATAFSVPGSWSALDPHSIDVDQTSATLTLPGNFLGISYNEVEATYTSGVVEIPPALKVACAQIVRNAQATPGLNVKSSRLDTVQMQYFSGSLLDTQVQMLLRPYLAEKVG